MSLLLRAVLRHLWVQRGMTASMICGIALASGSIVAVHMIAELVRTGLEGDRAGTGFGFTHFLHRPGLDEEAYLGLRSRWRAGELPGVSALVPLMEGQAVGSKAGRSVTVRVVGFDPLAVGTGAAIESEGDPAGAPGGLVSRAFLAGRVAWLDAPDSDVDEGDTIRFSTATGPVELALEARPAAFAGGGESLLVVDIGVAQQILERARELSRIGVVWRDPMAVDIDWTSRLFPGFAARRTMSENAWSAESFRVESVGDRGERLFAAAILFNLSVLSILCAVVAAFLIHQGAVNSISHRGMLFERLRAMGVSARWLTLHVTLEGLVIALLGAALGCGLGLLAAQGMVQALLGTDVGLASGATVWACIKAVVLSAVVGAVGMCLALRPPARARRRGLFVTGLVAAGVFGATTWSGLVGVFAIIAVLALAVALLAAATLGVWTASGRIGERSLTFGMNRRSLSSTQAEIGVALGGLVVALIAAYGLSLMVVNFRVAFEAMLDQRLDSDVYLESGGVFSASELARIGDAAGPAARLRLERRGEALVTHGASPVRVQVIHDAGPGRAGPGRGARYGFADTLDAEMVLINEPAVARFDWRRGGEVEVETERGRVRLLVAGVFRDYGAANARLVVAPETGRVLFGETPSNAVGLMLGEPSARARLRALAAAEGWRYRAGADVRAAAVDVFDRTFRLSDALVMIAVVIAVVGLFNALVALRIRRQREFRLLHVMGFSSAEFVRMNLGYGAMLGLHAVVVALPAGIVVGWLLCAVLNPLSFGWSIPFAVDAGALTVPAATGIVGATLSALMPGVGYRGERGDAR